MVRRKNIFNRMKVENCVGKYISVIGGEIIDGVQSETGEDSLEEMKRLKRNVLRTL